MLVDSHCHLNFPELVQNMDQVLDTMRSNEVGHALCVSVTLDKFPEVLAIAEQHPNIYASVGVHPDYEDIQEPTVEELVRLANHPRVVAIGETGLDYFRLTGDLEWQRHRFRTHIRAAKATGKPLIIHTRNAAEDTLRLMQEEGAAEVGGVMHCFTESWEVAQAAIEMGFYISFSGIVTFKNAQSLKDVAQKVPLDKILVETDSPYLAPIPFRGKTNQPAYVRHVAEEVARLRDVPLQQFMDTTTANFFKLFKHAQPCKSLS
ncbi:TatD family hydrolase [Methylophilus methylotrophus]|uniref:TatD family hydrolase n=1 Tax=Methylophilus methylotrophus TaxID=17 RepID=UPI000F599764|nr:TatD family hydrolase [Methylophilus methylotrophus]